MFVVLIICEIERVFEYDLELKSVWECFLNGRWYVIEFKEYLLVWGELSVIGKFVFCGIWIVLLK